MFRFCLIVHGQVVFFFDFFQYRLAHQFRHGHAVQFRVLLNSSASASFNRTEIVMSFTSLYYKEKDSSTCHESFSPNQENMDKRGDAPAHNPKVPFNENICPIGSACLAHRAVRWLEEHQ